MADGYGADNWGPDQSQKSMGGEKSGQMPDGGKWGQRGKVSGKEAPLVVSQ